MAQISILKYHNGFSPGSTNWQIDSVSYRNIHHESKHPWLFVPCQLFKWLDMMCSFLRFFFWNQQNDKLPEKHLDLLSREKTRRCLKQCFVMLCMCEIGHFRGKDAKSSWKLKLNDDLSVSSQDHPPHLFQPYRFKGHLRKGSHNPSNPREI